MQSPYLNRVLVVLVVRLVSIYAIIAASFSRIKRHCIHTEKDTIIKMNVFLFSLLFSWFCWTSFQFTSYLIFTLIKTTTYLAHICLYPSRRCRYVKFSILAQSTLSLTQPKCTFVRILKTSF